MVVREVCPACGSIQCKKSGHIHNGKQNYQCKTCRRQLVSIAENRIIGHEQRTLIVQTWPRPPGSVPFSMKVEGDGLHDQSPPHSNPVRPSPSSMIFQYTLANTTCGHVAPHRRLRCHPGTWREDAMPQKVDAGSPIRLPFQQL